MNQLAKYLIRGALVFATVLLLQGCECPEGNGSPYGADGVCDAGPGASRNPGPSSAPSVSNLFTWVDPDYRCEDGSTEKAPKRILERKGVDQWEYRDGCAIARGEAPVVLHDADVTTSRTFAVVGYQNGIFENNSSTVPGYASAWCVTTDPNGDEETLVRSPVAPDTVFRWNLFVDNQSVAPEMSLRDVGADLVRYGGSVYELDVQLAPASDPNLHDGTLTLSDVDMIIPMSCHLTHP